LFAYVAFLAVVSVPYEFVFTAKDAKVAKALMYGFVSLGVLRGENNLHGR